MRKLFILLLAFLLAACGTAPTPTEAPTEELIQPTQTPMVVVETVVVTVVPTNEPTQVPSATPLPPTEVPPTPTQPPAATAAVAAPPDASTSGGIVTLDNALGAGWFTNMTLSGNNLALRCQLYKDLNISVTPTDPNITEVQFYYRIEDRGTGAVFEWQNVGRMLRDVNNNFTLTFSGEDVNANYRKPNAWLDIQFVGLSRSGGVVGRSEKIVQQVNYMFDCP